MSLNENRYYVIENYFLGQWLRLNEINATTPDIYLYPEFDDVLNQAVVRETELFFAELLLGVLPVTELVIEQFEISLIDPIQLRYLFITELFKVKLSDFVLCVVIGSVDILAPLL